MIFGMKVTQQMVADRAGVGRSTVSTVLSGSPSGDKITEEVRIRIISTAQKLGYYPNEAARSLVSGRVESVGLVSPYTGGRMPWIWSELAEGVESYLFSIGYNFYVCRQQHDYEQQVLSMVRSRRAGAVIFQGLLNPPGRYPASLENMPTVFVELGDNKPCPRVGHDPAVGLNAAVDELHRRGHRRMLYIEPDDARRLSSIDRRKIVADRAARHGMTMATIVYPAARDFGQPHAEELQRIRADLASRLPAALDATAVMTWSDNEALAFHHLAAERGWRIPEDVSLIGFDNYGVEFVNPPIATVSGEWRSVGETAAELAVRMIRKDIAPAEARRCKIEVPTRFIHRDSMGRANKRETANNANQRE